MPMHNPTILWFQCEHCGGAMRLNGYLAEHMTASDDGFPLCFAYMAGWRHIEINGGETTDMWICASCREEFDGVADPADKLEPAGS